jgi:hypothetical protein
MPISKSIPGIQRGPDFDREVHETAHVERAARGAKLGRFPEANDPIVMAAIEAINEVASAHGQGTGQRPSPLESLLSGHPEAARRPQRAEGAADEPEALSGLGEEQREQEREQEQGGVAPALQDVLSRKVDVK